MRDGSGRLRAELFPFSIILETTLVATCTDLDDAERRAQQFANANPNRIVTIVDRTTGDKYVVRPNKLD